ncbi:MAG: hypothetical protein LBQ66_02385, partial [Planctomycetaceae bacterium]|nr:hypothetical protein [Planctomycetaceae bacterium]
MKEQTNDQPVTGSIFSSQWNNDSSDGEAGYRQVSVFALLALVFGVLSFLVYLTLWFTFISVLGIIFALCGV